MTERLLAHRESEKQAMIDRGETGYELRPLKVWTSTRRRTVETAKYLYEKGYKVRQRSQMSQLNPGVCEKMSENRIRAEWPDEVAKHELDPYHHRYPRAEVNGFPLMTGAKILNIFLIVLSRPRCSP
jgi:broad specificity phosphatase PhoE